MPKGIGHDARADWNTGTVAAPVWEEITDILDANIPQTRDSVDATGRGDEYATALLGPKTLSIEFNIFNDAGDKSWRQLNRAYELKETIEIRFLSHVATQSGSNGVRFTGVISSFTKSESRTSPQENEVVFEKSARATGDVIHQLLYI